MKVVVYDGYAEASEENKLHSDNAPAIAVTSPHVTGCLVGDTINIPVTWTALSTQCCYYNQWRYNEEGTKLCIITHRSDIGSGCDYQEYRKYCFSVFTINSQCRSGANIALIKV
ncbi:MAG TPA: hypothetical protein VFC84_17260 [Desulfosporosinus sp.]|nr:hypothetical protein [Desulfosporosinus sp.]